MYKHSKKQKIMLLLLLVVMSAYPPLSTDMYLPSLKGIAAEFGTDTGYLNLTLVLFFVFFSFSMLLWGPISDRTGRKPALAAGISLFSLSSAGCALAQNAEMLIAMRILQAIGAGAPATITLAIVQDVFKGQSRKKALALLTSLMVIAPVIAPTLGSLIISWSTWHTVFVILACFGLVSIVGLRLIPETSGRQESEPMARSLMGLFSILSNNKFRKNLILFSLPAIIIFGFIGGSSLIFMTQFGVSPSDFGLFFAVNASASIIGPILYIKAEKRLSMPALLTSVYTVITLSGIALILYGHKSPAGLIICLFPASLACSLLRPLGSGILLNIGGKRAGSSSSLINFFFMLTGASSMSFVTLPWQNRALVFSILVLSAGVVSAAGWALFANSGHSEFREVPVPESEG